MAVDRICPLLALTADLRTVVDGYDPEHRCVAAALPLAVDRATQQQLCLHEAHLECTRYRDWSTRRAGLAAGRRPAPDATFASTRLVLTPDPAWRSVPLAGGGFPRPGRRLAAGAAAVLVVSSVAAAGASTSGFGLIAVATGTPVPTPTPSATATPTPAATPSPVPSPTPSPTASATPAPTARPTPAPTATIYVVASGDTLSSIASRFGVSVQAIISANGLSDPNTLSIGQRLVIP